MRYSLHPALQKLREQIDERHPSRSRASDGWIGDTSHATRKSDHNPDESGVVHAIDITHDPANGVDCRELSEALRMSRDARIKYVIFSGRIFSSTVRPWEWRDYTGSSPHDKHMHVSTGGAQPEWDI